MPCVSRTFLYADVESKGPRMDLLGKMVAIDPQEPTAEERVTGITKLRYMMVRWSAAGGGGIHGLIGYIWTHSPFTDALVLSEAWSWILSSRHTHTPVDPWVTTKPTVGVVALVAWCVCVCVCVCVCQLRQNVLQFVASRYIPW